MATEFISRKYGNDGYEVIIKTDNHEHYKASEEFARRLIDHEKPTVREKLIELLDDNANCSFLGIDSCNTCPYRYEENCYTFALVEHLVANGINI